MYRYSLLLLFFVITITSCNSGKLTFVKQDRTVVTEEQIASVHSDSDRQIVQEVHSIRTMEEPTSFLESSEEKSMSSDRIQVLEETPRNYSEVIEFPILEEDSVTANDDITKNIKIEQALRSENLARVSLISGIFVLMSFPLALVAAFAVGEILGLIILLLGIIMFFVGWITFVASASTRYSTEKARKMRIGAIILLFIPTLILLISIASLFF